MLVLGHVASGWWEPFQGLLDIKLTGGVHLRAQVLFGFDIDGAEAGLLVVC